MDAKRASNTAEGAAIMRALHQQLLPQFRVLDDPISAKLVDTNGDTYRARQLFLAKLPGTVRARLTNFEMRSRYAEDCLAAACLRGIRQYVVLGAGLDTFAFRQPSWTHALQLFEVDHDTTQTMKKERLAQAGIDLPGNLTFAPVDFDEVSLPVGLANAGFNPTLPTFFSLLGVSQYLTQEGFDRTLAFVLSMPKTSEIVFSIVLPDDALPADEAAMAAAYAARNASIGEPWLTRPRPDQLRASLLDIGFQQACHLTPADADERYFQNRDDGLSASHMEQMMRAVV